MKTVQCVADMLDAPIKTVEKWFFGQSRPSFDWWGPILTTYGPEFVAAGMTRPPRWLNAAARDERKRELIARRADLEAQIALLRGEGER